MAVDAQGNYYDPATESATTSNNPGYTATLGAPAGLQWGAVGNALTGAFGQYNKQNAVQNGYSQAQAGINQGVKSIQDANTAGQALLSPYSSTGAAVGKTLTGNLADYQTAGAAGAAGLQQQANTTVNPNTFYNPGMAFAVNQGQQAMERSAAARGGVINSGALKDISSYITGTASQNYNNMTQLALQQQNQQIGANTNLMQGGLESNSMLGNMYNTGAGAAGAGANLYGTTSTNIAAGQSAAGQAAGNASAAGADKTGQLLGTLGTIAGTAFGGPVGGAIGGAIGSMFSDENVKEDIKPLSNKEMIDALNKLRAKTFKYDKYAKSRGASEGTHAGILAQDLEKSKAGRMIVSKNEDGVLQLDIKKTIGFLLASTAALNDRMNKETK